MLRCALGIIVNISYSNQDEYNLGNLLLDQASVTRLTQQIKGLQVN